MGVVFMKNEDLEQAKNALQNINEIADIKKNPVAESLVLPFIKSVPVIGDMLDLSMDRVIKDFQQKKQKELINVILKGKNCITSDMVNDIEFIMNMAKTMEAVKKLETDDKVKYFGNLIKNGYLSGQHIDHNEFDEYFDLLNTMSYREIQYLAGYKEYCKNHHERKNDEWQGFFCEYMRKSNLPDVDQRLSIIYMLPKLVRTGLVEEVYMTKEKLVNTEDDQMLVEELEMKRTEYKLTSSFDRFCELVLELQ